MFRSSDRTFGRVMQDPLYHNRTFLDTKKAPSFRRYVSSTILKLFVGVPMGNPPVTTIRSPGFANPFFKM